jgi:hypothetical protein
MKDVDGKEEDRETQDGEKTRHSSARVWVP